MLGVAIRADGATTAERDDGDPLLDVVLAFSAATGFMLALVDAAVGAGPLVGLPSVVIVAGHLARLDRIATAAAVLVWLRVLALSEQTGTVTPILMLVLCALLVIGPRRVLEWIEERWAERADRLRGERIAVTADATGAVAWIEELPDDR